MKKNMFETTTITTRKNRSIGIASLAGAMSGLCGVILDERSNVKTIAATAAYGLATAALIEATVPSDNASTFDCYVSFALVTGATALVGDLFNDRFGESIETEE